VSLRGRRTDRRTLIVALCAIIALLAAGVVAGISTRDVVAPVPVTESLLGKLACPSADRCVAVGSTGSRYTVRLPYTLSLADGAWMPHAPEPVSGQGDSFLQSISCPSVARCMAVGRQAVPAPFLGAKSGGDRPLVQTWDRGGWGTLRSPIPQSAKEAQLFGVDCIASVCMAVGTYGSNAGNERVLTQLWNGSSWRHFLPPKPRSMEDPSLASVSCTSTTSCTAVGRFTFELGFGTAIAPLILSWNGSRWRFEPSGHLGNSLDTELGAIDCPSVEVCVAVGFEQVSAGALSTFAEIREGGTWRVTATAALPNGVPDAHLVDVSCPSASRCVAVGYAVVRGAPRPLVEWWDGTRWAIGPRPTVPGASASAISGVRCTSLRSCVAVGNFRRGSPTEHGFTATWDGRRWTVADAPDPA
jgi:hypothetical protein